MRNSEHDLNNFKNLLDYICIQHGFCGSIKNDRPLHVTDIIPSSGKICVDDFVDWVFLADDMNPSSEPEKWENHKNDIRAAFIKIMGSSIIDADKLRY